MNSGEWLIALGRSSGQAGLLVLLVLVVQWLFRRQLAPRWRCALWLVVIIRLVPFSYSSATSIFNLLPRGLDGPTVAVAPARDSAAPLPDIAAKTPTAHAERVTAGAMAVDPAREPVASETVPLRRWSWQTAAFWVWLGGVTILGGHVLVSSIRFARRFAGLKPVEDPATLALLRDCSDRLRLRRAPVVVESNAVTSPALCGFFRPRLLLPVGFVAQFTEAELRFVLLHELAHLKRRDLPLNWLVTLLQIVHWFNPLVWLGLLRWRTDREIACDALAIDAAGATQSREYGRTILRLLEHLAEPAPAPGAVGILENKQQLRRRIRMIVNYVPARRWPVVAVVLLGGLAAIGLTDAQDKTTDASVPPPGKVHALKVTVLAAATGRPVIGAEVIAPSLADYLHPEKTENSTRITDAAGTATFAVPVDRPGVEQMQTFSVHVKHSDYAEREVTWIAADGRVADTLPDDYTVRVESGLTIGGFVRDEHGAPVAGAQVAPSGSGYKGFRLGSGIKTQQEFPSIWSGAADLTTDEKGYWKKDHFPSDLTEVRIAIVRPGGARAQFATPTVQRMPTDPSGEISLDALKTREAVLALKGGVTIRGLVVDEASQPLGGVRLRAHAVGDRYAFHSFDNQADGRFELAHWDAEKVILTAERTGYATKSLVVSPTPDLPEVRIVLPPARPLRVRVVRENDAPVAGAEFRIRGWRTPEQLLDWKGTADAEGRVTWATAPDQPVTFDIVASKDGLGRSVKLQADGTEQIVRLRKGSDQSITVQLRVVDAQSGQPLGSFEVWRRMQNPPWQPWGSLGNHGDFQAEVLATEFQKGIVPGYRLQIRATGYASWTSEAIYFEDGDQTLTVKLTKGLSADVTAPDRTDDRDNAISAELRRRHGVADTPELRRLGEAIGRLLETGDVEKFVGQTAVSLDDWNAVLPKNTAPENHPLGAKPERQIQRKRQQLAATAQEVIDVARRLGMTPGQVRFRVKTVTALGGARSLYKVAGQPLEIPFLRETKVVLTGEPTSEAAPGKPWRGDYQLSVGQVQEFPAGARPENGLRWTGFPAGVADEATQRDLALMDKIGDDPYRGQTLSGPDDEALVKLGAPFVDLLHRRSVADFVAAAVLSREGMWQMWQKNRIGTQQESDEEWQKLHTDATGAAQALLDQLDRVGLDLSDAQISLRQVIAEQARFGQFGSLDGVQGRTLRLILAVQSTRQSKAGQPISGEYVLTAETPLRIGGRWVLVSDKIRWEKFPASLLTKQDVAALELENYVAEHRTFPPGTAAPDIEMARFDNDTKVRLANFQGKLVLLEFWATWCGPCQEPMAKLQTLRDEHPEWKDRVEIVTVSIDDELATARAHLEKHGWTKTFNVWAGAGGWESDTAKKFRIRGVPTLYLLGRDGRVVVAGHPASLEATVANLIETRLR
jgi:bla regulator protein BlaR1